MFEQLPAQQWNADTAAHLMNRAGFGEARERWRICTRWA